MSPKIMVRLQSNADQLISRDQPPIFSLFDKKRED